MHVHCGVTVILPNECWALQRAGRPPLCWASTACEGTSCLGSVPASPLPLPSLACSWCRREKKLLSCSMVVLCQLCCWTRFNDHFLHIPNKTPLQMGCHNCNSIWELGCHSETVWSLRSGSLTRRDCSWDPRGWAGGGSPASVSGPVHGYAGWSLGLSGLEGG